MHFSLIKQVISSLVETPRPEMVDEGDMQYVQLLQGTPRTWSGTSSYVYMDTLCFSLNEIILIDELDHSVYVNAR